MRNPKRPQPSPLFELEQSLRKARPRLPQPNPAPPPQKLPSQPLPNQKVTAQAFDWDETIELEYRQEAFPDTSQTPSPFSEQYSFSAEPEDTAQSFEVEAFDLDEDEEQSAEVDAQVKTFELVDEDEVDAVDRAISAEPEATPVEVDVATPFSVQPLKSARPIAQSDSAEDAETDNSSLDVFDAEAFAADIEAILTGKTEVPVQPVEAASVPAPPPSAPAHPHDVFDQIAQGKLPPPTPTPTPTPSPEPPDQEEARPFVYSHAIFDQMAESMTYANSFNLGTISLEQQFDEFDRLLDQQEQQNKPEATLSHAAELDEAELAEDLALINGIEFVDQLGNSPLKGKQGKGSGGEKRKQPQKNPPSKNPAELPHRHDDPTLLFYLIWNNPEAKALLCQYARSYPALVGDLDLLMAIEAKDYDRARHLLRQPPELCTINCIAFDGMNPQNIDDAYLDQSIGIISGKFVEDHFRSGKFYSSPEAQQIAEILARSQQMAVPAIDTIMSADDSEELESGIDQVFSSEAEEAESIDRPEIATAMAHLFVVSADSQQQIIQALTKNSLTVDLINSELAREQKPQLTAPIKITRSLAPYDNCWNITDKKQLSYNIRITTDDGARKSVEVHDTTPEVEYAISALKSLEREFIDLRRQVAQDKKFPKDIFDKVWGMTKELQDLGKKLQTQRVALEELINLAQRATQLKIKIAQYCPKLTDQQRQENFLKDFDMQLQSAVEQELWQRGKNYGGAVSIVVPEKYWQPIRNKYHNQPIAKQKRGWGEKPGETVKYYVTQKSKSIAGFDISGHIWDSHGDTLETVFVLHLYWER